MQKTPSESAESAIWGRLLDSANTTLSPESARAILEIDFPQSDKDRMHELAAKARTGALSPKEQDEIDSYGRIGSFLSIMKSKARVALRKTNGTPSRANKLKRSLIQLVWARANSRCEYCQMPQEHDALAFEIDHVIAVSHSGPTQAHNLALACFLENSYKGTNLAGIDPISQKVTPLFNPRQQRWARHFLWDGPILVGRTAAGRATVAVLRINLPFRIAQRAVLIEEGVFPPGPGQDNS